ncbi:MAG: hypothetical protein LBL87_03780 [Ruminococcus sp.]|jgi:hypothetical protein|nr:hypothetical protein [Ruminococcus sp.]
MKERIFSDDFNESLFAKAVNENFKQNVSEEETYNVDFSDKHKGRMAKIFEGEVRDSSKYIKIEKVKMPRKRSPLLVWTMRIAAVFLLVFAVCAGYFLSLPGVRTAVSESIVLSADAADTEEKPTELEDDLTENVSQPYRIQEVVTPEGVYYLAFEPIDFKNVETYETGNSSFNIGITTDENGNVEFTPGRIYFIEEDGTLGYSVAGNERVSGVVQSLEDTEFRTVIMGDVRYHLYRSKSGRFPSLITWEHGGAELSISGYYSAPELQDMAQNVENSFIIRDASIERDPDSE